MGRMGWKVLRKRTSWKAHKVVISGVMPRLGPQERIWFTSSEVPRAREDRKDDGSPAESRAQPGARTHLAVLAVPRLSGADGRESPTSHRCRRPTPKRQLPWGKQQNKVCIRLLGRVKKELVKEWPAPHVYVEAFLAACSWKTSWTVLPFQSGTIIQPGTKFLRPWHQVKPVTTKNI